LPSIGLSMIVKNGGEELRLCLESVRSVVDQIVIADTGSTDNTAQIAAEFGATVISIPWEDDFAKARNRALEPMTTDWILVMDPDEALEEGTNGSIRSLLESAQDLAGYTVPIRNYFRNKNVWLRGRLGSVNTDRTGRASEAESFADHNACRLFRRHPDIRYSGRVHELVDYRIQSLGMRQGEANFRILHYGQLASPDVHGDKSHYYRKLGQLKVEDDPTNPVAWFELGSLEHTRFRNHEEALRCLYRAVEIAPDLLEAWVSICMIQSELRNHEAALKALAPLQQDPRRAFFVSYQSGELLHDLGRLTEARAAFRRAIRLCPVTGTFAHLLEGRLGYVEVRLGRHKSGLFKLRQLVARAPHSLEHHDMLMKGCVAAGDLEAAAEAAENTLKHFVAVKIFLRAAALRSQLQQPEKERALLLAGLRLFPDSPELQQAHNRLLGGKR
jgi:tetratricopeptide (TPR) repeat protein